jgi:hypothetical protein
MAYNATINYYRINQNNQGLATSNSGGTTNAPTEEIVAPLYSDGTFSSFAGNTVNGTATDFTLFNPGEYLYYLDNAGVFVLMGQIDSITNATALELTDTPLATPPGANGLYAAKTILTITEPFFIRVSTQKTGLPNNQAYIPDLTTWRASNSENADNQTSTTKLERVSDVGIPVSTATAANIPFTIRVENVFTPSGTTSRWPTFADIPDYIWLRATPRQTLSSTTAYRITTEENITEFLVEPSQSNNSLVARGYFGVGSTSSGNTGTGGTA